MNTAPYPGSQSVVRALRLLKSVGRASETGLGELVAESGLNRATVYRLLRALESEGLVERRDGGSRFGLGPELVALAARPPAPADLRSLARPELLRLAEETGETATLEVLAGHETLIVEEASGRHMVGAVPSVGTRWPAHATSTGKALLAHLPGADLDRLLEAPLPAPTPRTLVDPARLRRELARVRRLGYAVNREELEPGFVAVGAAVRAAGGEVVAALGVGGPATRVQPLARGSLALAVRRSAARLSARLGHREASAHRTRPASGASPRKETS